MVANRALWHKKGLFCAATAGFENATRAFLKDAAEGCRRKGLGRAIGCVL